MFREQLRLRLERSDVVLGISAAGNSPNVLAAMRYATARGAQTVALVGFGGGRLAGLVERALVVSSCDYGQVEDTHLALNHLITRLVVSRLVAEG